MICDCMINRVHKAVIKSAIESGTKKWYEELIWILVFPCIGITTFSMHYNYTLHLHRNAVETLHLHDGHLFESEHSLVDYNIRVQFSIYIFEVFQIEYPKILFRDLFIVDNATKGKKQTNDYGYYILYGTCNPRDAVIKHNPLVFSATNLVEHRINKTFWDQFYIQRCFISLFIRLSNGWCLRNTGWQQETARVNSLDHSILLLLLFLYLFFFFFYF